MKRKNKRVESLSDIRHRVELYRLKFFLAKTEWLNFLEKVRKVEKEIKEKNG